MEKDKDLTGELFMLQICIDDRHQTLDETGVGGLEGLWQLLLKVLSDSLDHEEYLALALNLGRRL